MNNSISSEIKELSSGEVTCEECKKGKMKPFNPNAKVNHSFVCDNCGNAIIIDPVVVVE